MIAAYVFLPFVSVFCRLHQKIVDRFYKISVTGWIWQRSVLMRVFRRVSSKPLKTILEAIKTAYWGYAAGLDCGLGCMAALCVTTHLLKWQLWHYINEPRLNLPTYKNRNIRNYERQIQMMYNIEHKVFFCRGFICETLRQSVARKNALFVCRTFSRQIGKRCGLSLRHLELTSDGVLNFVQLK